MELTEARLAKTEQVKIAEKIYDYREEKKDLELQLNDEKFHCRYIPKRKELICHEVIFRLLFIIPITFFALKAMRSLFWMFLGIYLIIADICLIIREIKMMYLLFISLDVSFIVNFAKEHDLNTFQKEQYKSKQKIDYLQRQIANIEQKIVDLESQRQTILAEQEQQEAALYEKENLPVGDLKESEKSSGLVLKKEATGSWDIRALYEYYLKEEQYLNNRLLQLDGKLQRMNKEIIKIEEDFYSAKKNIIAYFIILVLVAIIQSFFEGSLYTITAVLCFVIMLSGVFYLEKKCKQPILLYLVEQDNNLTREYAFCNNMIPVKNKRKELLEEIENVKKELSELKQQKEKNSKLL